MMKALIKNGLGVLCIFLWGFLSTAYSQDTDSTGYTEDTDSIVSVPTTIVVFSNGNTYGTYAGGDTWFKLNDGGYKLFDKAKKSKGKSKNKRTEIEGKWVVSEANSLYQYTHARTPQKMAHYKDESVIISGVQQYQDEATPAYLFINRSTDGGKTWHRIYQEVLNDIGFEFYQITHPSPAHIIALADRFVQDASGTYVKQTILLTSSDTAATWQINDRLFAPGEYPGSLHFKGQYGMMTHTTANKNELWYSSDYGTTWKKENLPADLRHAKGEVMGPGSFYLLNATDKKSAYTEDISSGIWRYSNLPDHFGHQTAFAIINPNTVWTTSAKLSEGNNSSEIFINATNDGGQNWNSVLELRDDNIHHTGLNNIAFANENIGVALGPNNSYFTKDGGLTWESKDIYDLIPEEVSIPQCIAYYYNPLNQKTMLLALMNLEYVLRYEFNDQSTAGIRTLSERNQATSLHLYPNPVKTEVNLLLPANDQTYTIRILSIDGRELSNNTYSFNESGIHKEMVHQLEKGVYTLQYISKSHSFNKVFIKE